MSDPTRPRRRWWVYLLRPVATSLLIAILFLVVLTMFFGEKFIFFPTREGDWDACKRCEFPIEEVVFQAPDGVKLFSWYLRVPKPRCTIIFFHGNAGNLADRISTILSLGHLDADVLIVGYHGYGRSEGSPGEKGFYLDADAAWRYLTETRGVPASSIVIYGESVGGGPAVELASKHPCAGLILQSAFTSIRDMAHKVIPLFPSQWFMKSKFDNLSKIPSIRVPKLFIATKTDEVVPYEQTRRLYETSSEPRTWVEYPDAGHNTLIWNHRKEWLAALGAFLDRIAPATGRQ